MGRTNQWKPDTSWVGAGNRTSARLASGKALPADTSHLLVSREVQERYRGPTYLSCPQAPRALAWTHLSPPTPGIPEPSPGHTSVSHPRHPRALAWTHLSPPTPGTPEPSPGHTSAPHPRHLEPSPGHTSASSPHLHTPVRIVLTSKGDEVQPGALECRNLVSGRFFLGSPIPLQPLLLIITPSH